MHWFTSPGEKYFGEKCIGKEVNNKASIFLSVTNTGMSIGGLKTLSRCVPNNTASS